MQENKPSLNQISFLMELLRKQDYIKNTFDLTLTPEPLYDISEKEYKRFLALIYNDKNPENKEALFNSMDLCAFIRS
jgi:hypothetical protein